MNILILRQPQIPAGYPGNIAGGACYLSDMLFHGLRNKFGEQVVDYERTWWMYAGDFGPGKLDPDIYCPRGFTIYRTLEDDSLVDRTDIEKKIKTKYFDLIIFAYTHYGLRPGSWDLVTENYPRNKIIWIDGGDIWGDLKPWAIDKTIYFKREFEFDYQGIYPISFSIPIEKIGYIYREKTRIVAPIDPRDRTTYIYDQERPYYEQYAESLFGVTMKKNGWDCMRHYEILANNCIPLFLDLEYCPKNTLTTLPKSLLENVLNIVKEKGLEYFSEGIGESHWLDLNDQIQNHFRKYCTTNYLARYVLDIARRSV